MSRFLLEGEYKYESVGILSVNNKTFEAVWGTRDESLADRYNSARVAARGLRNGIGEESQTGIVAVRSISIEESEWSKERIIAYC